MKHFQITLLCILSLMTGCASLDKEKEKEHIIDKTKQANAFRMKAMSAFREKRVDLALEKIHAALNLSQSLKSTTPELIENYDDAGLYFFMSGDYENAARYQSIAVLLSHESNHQNTLLATYKQRLGWAFAKYDPSFSITSVKTTPEVLLSYKPLALHRNSDIKRVFYREIFMPHKIQGKRYVLKD